MNSHDKETLLVVGFIVSLTLCAFVGVKGFGEYFFYISSSSKIEQLRMDMERLPESQSEDVIGQATEWNQTIMAKRRWNKVPFVQLIIPNGWEHVEPLKIPHD